MSDSPHAPRKDTIASKGLAGDPVIEIRVENADAPAVDIGWLKRSVLAATGHAGRTTARIGVLIVGDDRMRALHRQHSNVDSTTDVLTFPMNDNVTQSIQVDIVVCADEARRRAEELKHAVERELLLYIIHGLLHCCGFDDHTDADAARMHAEEDRILEAIGVGATFKRGTI